MFHFNYIIKKFIFQQKKSNFDNERINTTINATLNTTIKLTKTEIAVYKIIKSNPYITSSQIAEKTNKHRVTISKAISVLKENKIIERVGSNKTGYWNILA